MKYIAEGDYRMQHQAPDADYGAPLHNVKDMMPDFYTHPEYYHTGQDNFWDSANKIRGAKDQPEKHIRIYRSLPGQYAHEGFHTGDWVTTSKDYARMHGKANEEKGSEHDWPTISTRVPAKHLQTEGDVHEWAYNGPEINSGHTVAFKGGHHQEIRQRADGTIAQVKHKPKQEKPFKDWDIKHYVGNVGHEDEDHTVVAYDPEDNWAGRIRKHQHGEDVEIEPQHQNTGLEEHMRSKFPPHMSALVVMAAGRESRVFHSDPGCRVCNTAEGEFARTAAPLPAPYPNPYFGSKHSEGGPAGHHWYHGTHFDPEGQDDEEHGGQLDPSKPEESEYGERASEHWNTDLGTHFTSMHHVAHDNFAKDFDNSRVAHTTLHMANPKHYVDEDDMGRHAINWARENGHQYLPPNPRAHDAFIAGDHDEVSALDHDHRDYGYHDELGHDSTARATISHIDKHGPADADLEHVDRYLAAHPNRGEITEGFRQHLISKGHDGIVYGNSYEGPYRHASAIAFPETPVSIHHWQWMNRKEPQHEPAQHHDPNQLEFNFHGSIEDRDFFWHFTATWADVRAKAKRLRAEGAVRIAAVTLDGVSGEVQGEHHIYETGLNFVPGSHKVGSWECGCKWSAYAWGRSPAYKRFEGRMCSHALAMQFEAQARGMFGKEIHEDQARPKWLKPHSPVVIQYERPSDKHPQGIDLTRRAVPPGNMRSTWGSYRYQQTVQGPEGYSDEEREIEGPLYHGGRGNLGPGDHIVPGRKTNSWGDEGNKSTHVYFTTDPSTALSYSHAIGPKGKLYEVEPTGDFKKDYGPQDYKTPHPLRVVRQVPQEEWPGWAHTSSLDPEGVYPDDHGLDLARSPADIMARAVLKDTRDPAEAIVSLRSLGMAHRDAQDVLRRAMGMTTRQEGAMVTASRCPDCYGAMGAGACSDCGRHTAATKSPPAISAEFPEGRVQSQDARADATKFGEGVPDWHAGPIIWCDGCGGIGCGHCGGTGQVINAGGTTVNPIPDQNDNAGQMIRDEGLSVGGARHYAAKDDGQVYLRFGAWPKNERSQNNVTGHPEDGVSVYDLDHHGNPMDPDANLGRMHEHDESCEPDCDLDSWNEDYGNDTHEEMQGRVRRAEKTRFNGNENHSDTGHLVKGEMAAIGHDGEPLLRNVRRVGDWIDHRHLFFPQAERHRLARDPYDDDYEPPTEPPAGMSHHAAADEPEGPSVAGVALKAADTGRVLMLQRGLEDEDDPARGTWEFPGGHLEDGDKTSLHGGMREWEEEVGQPFPEGGTVHHVWTSPNGIYQGHVVVIPHERSVALHDGHIMPNPDDPKGDKAEQAAWWDVDHARKNPALRPELKSGTPWKQLKSVGVQKQADYAANDPFSAEESNPEPPPLHSNSTNPASSGWATSVDPSGWNGEAPFGNRDDAPMANYQAALAPPIELAPVLGEWGTGQMPVIFDRSGTLHDHVEPALPSTDGDLEYGDPSQPYTGDSDDELGAQEPDFEDEGTPSSVTASRQDEYDPDVANIVAQFQATAAAGSLMSSGGGAGDFGGSDIAGAAQAFLSKTALKDFNFAEQQVLINEHQGGKVRARNTDNLQIGGTHYELLDEHRGAMSLESDDLFV